MPRLEVTESTQEMLVRLASAEHDPRRVVLVEEAPADGFRGSATEGEGTILEFDDRQETLHVRIGASEPGFLFLADQLYPGWEAAVQGTDTPILRANYVFRAVRIPAGESVVTFRYRPRSLRIGFLVSALTTIAIVAVSFSNGLWSKRHRLVSREGYSGISTNT